MSGKGEVTSAVVRRGETFSESEARPSERVEGPEATPKSGGSLARVEYKAGTTINMGNYESLRVDVGIVLPSRMSPDSLDTTFEFCREWVEGKLEEEIARIMKERDDK
jgi:hypothetical protein